jgi:UPF0755 protein
VSTDAETVSVTVKENQTTTAVLAELKDRHLIRSSVAARIYLRLHTNAPGVRPGVYALSPSQSLPEILTAVSAGPKDIRVTFPEGWRREQFAQRLAVAYQGIQGSRFNETDFLALTQNREGSLFPDTYDFPANATAADIVQTLTQTFTAKTGLNPETDRDTIIIASLVERESRIDAERPAIAGVIHNRLDSSGLLNIDATVQFARDSATQPDKYWLPLTSTQFPSLYNTYLHTGLPPGPICNPGLSSIEAAKAPVRTSYMYYLHDASGVVHFATSLDEHNRNVDKYLKP